MILNNLKLKDNKGFVNPKFYDRLIERKAPVMEEDMELWKSMIRTMCKTEDEEQVKKLMGKLAPYLRNKIRPILFMGSDTDVIRSETIATINKMMIEVEINPITIEKNLEVSISGDTMQIDQTSVTINIDGNPFVSSDHPKPHSKGI